MSSENASNPEGKASEKVKPVIREIHQKTSHEQNEDKNDSQD